MSPQRAARTRVPIFFLCVSIFLSWKRIEKMKRAFALLAVVTCEQRETVETRGRVACHLVKRPRKERWKREFGLLAMPTCEPRKKPETRVLAARKVDMRARRERWKRVCGVFTASTGGLSKKEVNASAECLSRRQGAQEKKMETRVRAVRNAALLAKIIGGTAWSGCLQHCHAAQERKMET